MSEDNQAIRDLHKLNADTLEKTTIMLLTATTLDRLYFNSNQR